MLSGEQLRRFAEDGYLVVPGVVPENLLAAVDDEIDALVAADPPPPGAVGKHFWFLPPWSLAAADAAGGAREPWTSLQSWWRRTRWTTASTTSRSA